MKTVVFAQTYQSNNTCVLGSSTERVYADQMDKQTYTEQDSFLELYRWNLAMHFPMRFLEQQLDIDIFSNSRFPRDKIYCAMKRIPNVNQTKKTCTSSNQNGKLNTQLPCVTDQMIDYIQWGLNETFDCFDNELDNFERKIIFKKINHESAFGFFFQYIGGTGLTQLVQGSQKDMFTPGFAGNTFLMNHVRNHPKACSSFTKLIKRSAKSKNLKSCEFMSMGDGIGRSLIGGVGLYIHYRSDPQNPYSAEKLLSYWGYKPSQTELYRKARAYLTLGMYNKGPGAVINDVKFLIAKNALLKKPDTKAYKIILNVIEQSSFYDYIRAVELSASQIFNKDGSCKI